MPEFQQEALFHNGAEIVLRWMMPKNPKAVVQINHGMAEHGLRYERFAQALFAAGYGVFVHDTRGHGGTNAAGSALGHFASEHGLDLVLGDLSGVNSLIRSRHSGVPLVCFGHSMGAILGLNYVLRNPDRVDALVFWNSNVEAGLLVKIMALLLKAQRYMKGGSAVSGLAQAASFGLWNKAFKPNRTAFDWLSRDEAEVDKYVADPLCGFDVSIALWQDVIEAVTYAASDTNLANLPRDMPVHLLTGARDPCTENGRLVGKLADRLNATGVEDVTFGLLPETRHESLNELNRDETTAGFIAWLDGRF